MRAPKELVPVLRAFLRFWQQPNGPVETHLRSLIEAVLLQGAKASNVLEDSILSRPPEMVGISAHHRSVGGVGRDAGDAPRLDQLCGEAILVG